MKLAFMADIHGNSIALDAVLADIESQGGVDGYWIVGDLVAIGSDPITVLERLTSLENTTITRGNTDRYVYSGNRPPPNRDEVLANNDLLDVYLEVEAGFSWTQGYLTPDGWVEWLERLPLEARLTLPDGTRLLAVHAAPGTDFDFGFDQGTDRELAKQHLEGCNADLVFVGHTHWPVDQIFGSVRVVNTGSVSNPIAPDLRASYVILHADEDGYHVQFRRVEYDIQAAIDQVLQVRHPTAAFIIKHFRGENRHEWSDNPICPPLS